MLIAYVCLEMAGMEKVLCGKDWPLHLLGV